MDYGDGTDEPLVIAGKQFTLAHQYAAEGTYTVTVSLKDDDVPRSFRPSPSPCI